jgi:hypothetical protein
MKGCDKLRKDVCYKIVTASLTLLLFVTGCQSAERTSSSITVKPVDLEHTMENVFSAISPSQVLLNVQLQDEGNYSVKLWIEVYENGKLVEDSAVKSAVNELEGGEKISSFTMMFAKQMMEIKDSSIYEQWTAALIDQTGSASMRTLPMKRENNKYSMGSMEISDEMAVDLDQPMVAAYYVENERNISLPNDVLVGDKQSIQQIIEDYPRVTLCRYMISKISK